VLQLRKCARRALAVVHDGRGGEALMERCIDQGASSQFSMGAQLTLFPLQPECVTTALWGDEQRASASLTRGFWQLLPRSAALGLTGRALGAD
jgi:hypothetical protein